MRVIEAQQGGGGRGWGPLAAPIGMAVAGLGAAILVASGPALSAGGFAALALGAPLGLGIGAALLVRRVEPGAADWRPDELVSLLAPAVDDSWWLVLRPRLDGLEHQPDALLVGPPGVRAVAVRTWHGRYRLRGRRWEYQAGGRDGWITCRTDPGYEALQLRGAVARWAAAKLGAQLPVEAAVAFPRSSSRIALEEPEVEVITTDNAPWWAQRVGRVQRLDAGRVAAVVQAAVGQAPVG